MVEFVTLGKDCRLRPAALRPSCCWWWSSRLGGAEKTSTPRSSSPGGSSTSPQEWETKHSTDKIRPTSSIKRDFSSLLMLGACSSSPQGETAATTGLAVADPIVAIFSPLVVSPSCPPSQGSRVCSLCSPAAGRKDCRFVTGCRLSDSKQTGPIDFQDFLR